MLRLSSQCVSAPLAQTHLPQFPRPPQPNSVVGDSLTFVCPGFRPLPLGGMHHGAWSDCNTLLVLPPCACCFTLWQYVGYWVAAVRTMSLIQMAVEFDFNWDHNWRRGGPLVSAITCSTSGLTAHIMSSTHHVHQICFQRL